MKDEHAPHTLNFKVDKTSQGYLLQGIEIPEIILEVPTEKDIAKYVDSAVHCYFKSFPEQHDIVFGGESQIIQIPVTV